MVGIEGKGEERAFVGLSVVPCALVELPRRSALPDEYLEHAKERGGARQEFEEPLRWMHGDGRPERKKMMEFEFDLVFSVPMEGFDEDAVLDALFEAGFDDGIVGLGTPGFLAIGVTREGHDAEEVIVRTARAALPAMPQGAMLREVRPDLVSLADVAERLGISRQALQRRRLPPASLNGLYRASEVGKALTEGGGRIRDNVAAAARWLDAAMGAQRVNALIALGKLDLRN